jgi:hypothetical protein
MRFASISNGEVLAQRIEAMMHPRFIQVGRAIRAEPWPVQLSTASTKRFLFSVVIMSQLSLLASALRQGADVLDHFGGGGGERA